MIRLYNLLGKLWNCMDYLPSFHRSTVADYFQEIEHEIKGGCTYAQMGKYLNPY
jgi:hypothetical protein